MIDLTHVIGAIIVLIFAIVARYLIPYIKSKCSAEKFTEICTWVRIAVEAAEMIFRESGMGEKKKQYVLAFLESKGFTLNADELNNLIEAEVHLLQGNIETE